MGILSNTRELKEDVLFRASEQLSGSKFEPVVMGYLNRAYRTLCTGASEFLPEYVEDWWWLRGEGVMNLEPVYQTGSVAVTTGDATAVFNPAPSTSLTGYRLKIDGQEDISLIQSHTAGVTGATLDLPWSGDTVTSLNFMAMKVEYTLSVSVQALTSPIVVFREPMRIIGVTPEKLDELYPLVNLTSGVPQAFALKGERTVRFSHGGSDEGKYFRAEYKYRPKIDDLTDSTSSVPLVPIERMAVLADMALTYLLMDKNDDRSNAVALAARTGLAAMLKENRRRNVKIDPLAGRIITRPGQVVGSGVR